MTDTNSKNEKEQVQEKQKQEDSALEGNKVENPGKDESSENEEEPQSILEIKIAKLEEEKRELEIQSKEKLDQALRIQAEFENARRRFEERKKIDLRNMKADLLKQFITVYEEFHQISNMEINEELNIEKYHEGIDKLFQKFDKVLKEAGLEAFGVLGEEFDPSLHQAIQVVDTDDEKLDQTIEKVLSRGYKLSDYIIKPAMVIIYQA